jgi:hypothetical protein
MADVKISGLPASTTPLAGTEVLPVVQGGQTRQVSVANLTAGRAVSAASLALTGSALPVGSGGTGLTAVTAGYIPFGSTSTALSTTSILFWDAANNVLGVGTSSPNTYTGNKIVAYGGGIAATSGAGTTSGSFQVFSNGQTNNQVTLAQGFGGTDNIGFLYNRANADFVFGTNNTEAMRIAAAGNITVSTGNLVIGTSGKGIDFSATAGTGTSELFADYEEGTWTPSLSAGSGTITSFTSSGRYTKNGRLVTAEIRIDITDNGNAATGLIIGNFPFTAYGAKALTGAAREDASAGIGIVGSGLSTTSIYLTKVDNTYPGGTGYGFTIVVSYSV